MVNLSVNLNKIALIRNSRAGNFPDLLTFGRRCLALGVQGLTVHPRPDQRHIRASDILPLAKLVSEFPGREFNMEGNPFAAPLGGIMYAIECLILRFEVLISTIFLGQVRWAAF